MADNTTDISSADLRDVARELSQSRAEGREVATVPEAAPSAPATEQSEDADEGMSLRVAAQRRAARTAREAAEREAYERAAQLSERELPANLDASDSELAQQELRQLRESMAAIQQNQDTGYQRMRAEEAAHQQVAQVNEHYEQSRQWASAANTGLEVFIQQERQQLLQMFPEAASDAGVIELARTDPYRAQEYAEAFQAGEGRIALAVREQQQALQNYAQHFEGLAQLHDQTFAANNPDLAANPDAMDAAGRGAIAMLQAHGYREDQIREGWTLGTGPLSNLRDFRVQQLLLNEWRGQQAQKHLAEAKEAGRPAPPRVQRPGSPASSDVNEHTLRSLTRSLEDKGSVKAAAALLSARRAYQRGTR